MKKRESKILRTEDRGPRTGFTLVELMIVVSILGILAAIVLPEFSGHVQQAKESAAKDNLRILREAVERYAFDHNGIPPGYPDCDPARVPSGNCTLLHLVTHTTRTGQFSIPPNPNFPYGPYLSKIPKNPFNGSNEIWIIYDEDPFLDDPPLARGWCYKPQTKEVKICYKGTDSEGNEIYDY